MNYRIENQNLDGTGSKPVRVFDMPVLKAGEYWPNVTDVPCPIDDCQGIIRWYEAGYVPGYRLCDRCKRHFLAKGNSEHPTLVRMGSRKGGFKS